VGLGFPVRKEWDGRINRKKRAGKRDLRTLLWTLFRKTGILSIFIPSRQCAMYPTYSASYTILSMDKAVISAMPVEKDSTIACAKTSRVGNFATSAWL